jgi:polyisoprenoid-binding protein YceI
VTHELDAGNAQCLVFTEKEGLLSAAAHDLKLRVERFHIRVGAGTVEGELDPASLRVVCARRAGVDVPGLLSPRDRAEIEANIAAKVLGTRTYPSIRFRSTSATVVGADVRIDLLPALHGRERSVVAHARKEGERAVAECTISQPDFGIQPFSAMLGALKVKARVTVQVVAPADILAQP